MYKIPSNTLFLGKNVVYVPQCHSTNTLATELGLLKGLVEGTVVITDDQTAGRGQRGNTWETAPGMNLTLSLILKPVFLQARNQFSINQVVSLAIAAYLAERTSADVRIKWPNDILVNEKKLCGILIENHLNGAAISNTVIGIGLNINQPTFRHIKASSLHAITGKTYDLQEEFSLLLGCLEAKYLELRSGQTETLHTQYLRKLYRMNEPHRFGTNGVEWTGVITGVDETGRLKIEAAGEVRVFDVKAVAFL